MKEYDVVVVGAGMAGLTSAIYLARAGKSVLVLEGNVIGGQIVGSLKVENWPGELEIAGTKLMEDVYKQVKNLDVEVRYEEVMSVTGATGDTAWGSPIELDENGGKAVAGPVAPSARFFIETDENKYECKAVIIATGTSPRKLSGKQAKEVGDRPVSYCATCDGALYKDKPVVVIGSGNTAKYEIKYLEGICAKVYHIHHDDPIPEEAEAIFVATKRVPETGFLQDLVELDAEGYIVAGEDCKTSCAGVFVAGDCRAKSVRQLVTAAGDGAIAAGAAVRYLK
ncbi:MAG: FAD-dependent oxidoreductase [Candidatus Saccharibacteria bacterium]|nr:FAD-dependent oxidoreductase [Candidatus Saccharibacteria bacterium]